MNEIINFILYDVYNGYDLRRNRRRRQFMERRNYFAILDAIDFKRRFRIFKNRFIMLLERIAGEIEHNTNRYVCVH